MTRYLILLIAILIISTPIRTEATIERYEKVASLKEENIILYAREMNGYYSDFKIKFKDGTLSRPFWINETNPAWYPEIIYEDVNQDRKKELIIILTKGHGTGLLEQEAYIFHIEQKEIGEGVVDVPVEVLIDNPIAIIMKNVKTQLTSDNAKISIDDKHYTIDINPLGINDEQLFGDVHFGNITKYEVTDNQLIAKIAGHISPAGFIGEIVIVYEYQDQMYQAYSIKFRSYE